MRLDSTGAWFPAGFGERRVGGRIAIAAQIMVGGQPITFVSVHLESHSDPQDRAESTRRLIKLIEEYDDRAPVVVGGDFNTSTGSLAERRDRDAWRATLKANPKRVLQPEPFEPLFEHFARAGFDWAKSNAPFVSTERPDPHEQDDAPLGKIDWFFTRNIKVSAARVVPAITVDGSVISDHDMLLLRIP
jgi:endonuclease/exonuclease/phosphatase family metal-dependent hydrolase